MTIDLLFGLVAITIVVVVFTSRARREKGIQTSRDHILQAASPIIGGSLAHGKLTGTYKGHSIEASLLKTGRMDNVGGEHSSSNTIEVLLLVLHGVSGRSPWGFYTSVSFTGSLEARWRSTITLAGVLGKLASHISTIPIDPGIDDRLRAAGMLQAFERLVPRDVNAPYVVVSFVPDGAPAIARMTQRAETYGGPPAERAREEAAKALKLGGFLRIEVERADDRDPAPERFRELLDAALAIAELNATINT